MYPEIVFKGEILSHPWCFQNQIEKPAEKLPPGTVADLVDRRGRWLARGHYNGHARIAFRVLTRRRTEKLDADWIYTKLESCLQFREEFLQLSKVTSGYRLVHSEGDGLSGLVIDRYQNLLVAEIFSAGMYRMLPVIRSWAESHQFKCYAFAESRISKQESFDFHPEPLPEPVLFSEYGVEYLVQPGSFHKTGFFLDQRENRREFASFCEGKELLDLCTHTGGFAIAAMKLGKAKRVVGIDRDPESIELAKANAKRNKVVVEFRAEDIAKYLEEAYLNGDRFDTIVLDLPRQSKNPDEKRAVLVRYQEYNRLALQVLNPKGVILTCSCTGFVSREDLIHCVSKAAQALSANTHIFKVTSSGPDHPFSPDCYETNYLDCLWIFKSK